MADRRDIVEFIREVEKHPCIYNVTLPEYVDRNERKRAWCTIAEAMNSTEHECKERWRVLRIAFMRSRKHANATNQNKPYYLYNYLTFLLPFVKTVEPVRENEVTVTSSPVCAAYEDISPMNSRKFEIEIEDDKNDLNSHVVYLNDSYDRQRQIERKRQKSDDVESSPRKMFLLSLLPDVESLSDEGMRTFRRTVVNCIDNIIDARNK